MSDMDEATDTLTVDAHRLVNRLVEQRWEATDRQLQDLARMRADLTDLRRRLDYAAWFIDLAEQTYDEVHPPTDDNTVAAAHARRVDPTYTPVY